MTMGANERAARTAGFSVLELLLALAVLALATSAVVAPTWRSHETMTLYTAGAEISSLLRRARDEAIRTGRSQSVVVDVPSRTFGLAGDGAPRRPAATISLQLIEPSGETVSERSFRFAPDGSSNGGTVVVGASRGRMSIVVDELSGHAGTGGR